MRRHVPGQGVVLYVTDREREEDLALVQKSGATGDTFRPNADKIYVVFEVYGGECNLLCRDVFTRIGAVLHAERVKTLYGTRTEIRQLTPELEAALKLRRSEQGTSVGLQALD